MVKILHCADIHLDSPFCSESMKNAEVRRNELRGTFTSMMMYVFDHKIDLVLIAGDLFDREFATKETVSLLHKVFAANPTCRFVIAPGNHDPYTADSIYAKTEFPENVYIFKSSEVSCFSFDDLNIDVYGYAFESKTYGNPPISNLLAQRSDRINLLCCHTALSMDEQMAPISKRDLEYSGMDYAALGHIHNSTGIEQAGNCHYGFSGCLEGKDYGETGYKGAVLVEIEKEGTVAKVSAKGIRFSKRRYAVEQLDVSGAESNAEIAYLIKQRMQQQGYGEDTLLRIVLEGMLASSLVVSPSQIEDLVDSLFELDLIDHTMPLLDFEKLKQDPTIRGAFFAELEPMLQSTDSHERETAARALRYGFAALDGRNILDM